MASFAFRAVCLFLVALALCQGALAVPDMTPAQRIRGACVEITAKADALRIEAAKINDPVGGFRKLSTKVAPGFSQITFKVSAAAAMIASRPTGPLGTADAKMVAVALKAFVRVHQALLGVAISKSGLLPRHPIQSHVREALVALGAAVDSFACALSAVIPTEKGAADAQFAALRVSVTKAQAAYAQIAALRVSVTKLLDLFAMASPLIANFPLIGPLSGHPTFLEP